MSRRHTAPVLIHRMSTAWNPWAELRQRGDIRFAVDDLPSELGGGVAAERHGRRVIVVDRRLDRTERNAALAHELIHHERGLDVHREGMPETWTPVVARDERAVEREVARRLVPLRLLAEFADRLADMGAGVEPWVVMEEFDVPWNVAATALDLLNEWERGGRS